MALRIGYGVHGGTPSALFVIDDAGIIRFVHAPSGAADRDPTFASVVKALHGDALHPMQEAFVAEDGLQ